MGKYSLLSMNASVAPTIEPPRAMPTTASTGPRLKLDRELLAQLAELLPADVSTRLRSDGAPPKCLLHDTTYDLMMCEV